MLERITDPVAAEPEEEENPEQDEEEGVLGVEPVPDRIAGDDGRKQRRAHED